MKIRATNIEVVQVEVDAVVVSFFHDERPLKGHMGLADWRLCGMLSRFILDGRIDGGLGEKILFPMNHRMKCRRVLAIGLGAKTEFDDRSFATSCRLIADTLFRLQIAEFALSLPGAIIDGFDAVAATAKLCEEIGDRFRVDRQMFKSLNLSILAEGGTLKDINPIVAKYEHRFSEELGG
ncbi:MAG: hypothetical protein KJ042_15575 [Deltaproteobacteria bacterium]|nr:hypothetical protein [Deltaproteobacteria bacterium]